MRWPWQSRRGIVRVSSRRLIALQRGALRAAELEREVRPLAAERRALEVLASSPYSADAVSEGVLAELPLTAQGKLHELAFLALVDAHVWEQREKALAETFSTGRHDQ